MSTKKINIALCKQTFDKNRLSARVTHNKESVNGGSASRNKLNRILINGESTIHKVENKSPRSIRKEPASPQPRRLQKNLEAQTPITIKELQPVETNETETSRNISMNKPIKNASSGF